MVHSSFEIVAGDVQGRVGVGSHKVLVLTDSWDEGTNIGRMIRQFTGTFTDEVEVIDLNEVDITEGKPGLPSVRIEIFTRRTACTIFHRKTTFLEL